MWGTQRNFCLPIIDELEKQLFIKKNCWSRPIKKIILSILIHKYFNTYKK